MKGGPFGDIKEIAKKSLTKPKKIYTKKIGQGRVSNPCPSAWQTSKSRNLYAKCQCGLVLVPDNVSARQQC